MDLVNELAEKIVGGNAVFFVDAGLSLAPGEPSPLAQISSYLVKKRLYTLPQGGNFSDVAQAYVDQERGDQPLINFLRMALRNLNRKPAPLYDSLIGLLPPSAKIITTIFDRRLEEAFFLRRKDYRTILESSSVPYFDESQITLIKMRGDIDHPKTLVLTTEAIEEFTTDFPTMSDLIWALFVTKTLIFLGNDLSSHMFRRFFRKIEKRFGEHTRPAYAIIASTLPQNELAYWRGKPIKIYTKEMLPFLQTLALAIKKETIQPQLLTPRFEDQTLPNSPYKLLESFTLADAAIFAGRNEESSRLKDHILANPITVLYGESGTGKSSLLQAGTGPLLAKEQTPLMVCEPTKGQPLLEKLRQSFLQVNWPHKPSFSKDENIYQMIRAWQALIEGPVVLAIDQFEQFFLVYDEAERQIALENLSSLLGDNGLHLRLVLVIREDFLGRLGTLAATIPNILEVRFRLERLGRQAAQAAIEEPARAFKITWEAALVDKLLDELYEGNHGGVQPPQLQIVCDHLVKRFAWSAIEARGTQPESTQITLAELKQEDGAEAILGGYLEATIAAEFPDEAEQKIVRALLGALITSQGVKQRLTLNDLARTVHHSPEEAERLLNRLTMLRLLQRYKIDVSRQGANRPTVAYELTHDYLVSRIISWLGDDFRQKQYALEIIRTALPEWQQRQRLLSPDDVRLINEQRHQIDFSLEESEMIYAAAASYADQITYWQAQLPRQIRQKVLLQLLSHEDSQARQRAAEHLRDFPRSEVASFVAQAAYSDSDRQVRQQAAQTIAVWFRKNGQNAGRVALRTLIDTGKANHHHETHEALVRIRDVAPDSQDFLPADWQRRIWPDVRRTRWQRYRSEILDKTLRGALGGFLGGLGIIGLFLSERNLSNVSQNPETLVVAAFITGIIVSVAVTCSTFTTAMLRRLQDFARPTQLWVVMALLSALLLGMGMFIFIELIMGGGRSAVYTLAAALLLGFGLMGTATAPLRLGMSVHLFLTIVAGMIVFWIVGTFLFSLSLTTWWLFPLGAVTGFSFFWGVNSKNEGATPQ